MVDKQASAEEQENLDLLAGFNDEAPAQKADVVVEKPEEKVEPEKKDATPAATAGAKTETPPVPEYAQITKDELASLKSAAEKATALEKKYDTLLGTTGSLKQIIKELQANTPKGEAVELPKLTLAKVRADFPDLADLLEGDLAEQLKGLRGKGDKAEIDPKAMSAGISEAVTKLQVEALEDAHADWRKIVGAPEKDGDAIDETIPYRVWLATQPADYVAKINSTQNAAVISRSIELFLKHQAAQAGQPKPKPTPKVEVRKSRIEDSLQPRGDGGPAGAAKPTENAFEKGFEEG
jgi:hypothetical protein